MTVKVKRFSIVFLLKLLLLGPWFFPQKMESGMKSLDDYWADSGLQEEALTQLLDDENCYSQNRRFLACLNAVQSVASNLNLKVDTYGILRDIKDQEADWISIEKNFLNGFESAQERFQAHHVSFFNIWETLKNKRKSQAGLAPLVAQGVNGYLSVLEDPHTYIMPIAYFEEVLANAENQVTHIGAVVRKIETGGDVVVKKVFEGSSAEKSGLKQGDVITEVNGKSTAHVSLGSVVEKLKMRDEPRLLLKIRRNQEAKWIEVLRQKTALGSVHARVLENRKRLGMITIHKFARETCRQTEESVKDLVSQGVQGLILDLRENPGGQVDEARCVISLFTEKNKLLFETRYFDVSKPSDYYYSDRDPIYRGSLVVLVNSGSASAAEIVAGSLKDLGRATLVGERTFGKGSFQDGKLWAHNRAIALFQTEGLYYFPSGWTPQLMGIEPDLNISLGSYEARRERDLYKNPITPLNVWAGPQSVSWLAEMKCDFDQWEAHQLMGSFEDPQLNRAQAWLSCGESYDRHGSL